MRVLRTQARYGRSVLLYRSSSGELPSYTEPSVADSPWSRSRAEREGDTLSLRLFRRFSQPLVCSYFEAHAELCCIMEVSSSLCAELRLHPAEALHPSRSRRRPSTSERASCAITRCWVSSVSSATRAPRRSRRSAMRKHSESPSSGVRLTTRSRRMMRLSGYNLKTYTLSLLR